MPNETQPLVATPMLGPEQGLNRYLAEIRKFPILSAEQKYMLAKSFHEHGETYPSD